MKKVFSLGVFVLLAFLFSNNAYGQNRPEIGESIKYQFNKFFDLTGDAQFGNDEALKIKKRLRLKDGLGDGIGFVDEDGDGVCDNCGGTGECDRTRDMEGKRLKKRGGN